MINLPNILPIRVVGTISGSTASGTPTDIFSLAAIQNVVIVNQDPLEVELIGGTGVTGVDALTVSGGSTITGTVDFVGSNGVNVSAAGTTITFDGAGIASGGGGGSTPSVDSAALFVPFPGSGIDGSGDGTDDVFFELDYPVTVNQATSKLTGGSLTYTISIDDVEIQGLDNQGVTTSRAVDTATSANSYAIGQEFRVAVSGASSAEEFRLTIKTTRL